MQLKKLRLLKMKILIWHKE